MTLNEYKEIVRNGVNSLRVRATVYYDKNQETRIIEGRVTKVQSKEYVITYGEKNEQFWLRFPLVREIENISDKGIEYSTFDRLFGPRVSTSKVELLTDEPAEKPKPKPATAFDQVDLFGNPTTPQTEQICMFGK